MNPEVEHINWGWKAIQNTLSRKDTWESEEQARIEFLSSPFYKHWDIDMRKIYVDSAFYETAVVTPTGVIKHVAKTKMSSFQEAIALTGADVSREALTSLQNMDESVRLHFIMSGAEGAPQFGPPGASQERVWLRPKNSSNVIIKKAGHLIPQEAPAEVAQEITQFLERYYNQPSYRNPHSNL